MGVFYDPNRPAKSQHSLVILGTLTTFAKILSANFWYELFHQDFLPPNFLSYGM